MADFPVDELTEELQIGTVSGGNFVAIETDGTIRQNGTSTVWDEVSQNLVGRNLDVSSGRIDYNYNELTIDYQDNARYPNEVVGVVTQATHAWKIGSDFKPHIHWIQNQSVQPNILIEYRFYNNGETVPTAFTQKALGVSDNKFAYPGSGSMQQITEFNLPAGFAASLGLSCTFDCKIYRDSNNTSGLFAGADTYSGVWSAKYFDIHYELDTNGSRQEFNK